MNKYQELEQQIQTLQEEHQKRVQELQEQVELLKKEEQESKLPESFNRERVISYLNKPSYTNLICAFGWHSTPQGWDYWHSISLLKPHKVPEFAIIQLQKWVIQSYQEQYGN
jgi:site-specific DNA-adenine methylase